jgi:hypothetical protein
MPAKLFDQSDIDQFFQFFKNNMRELRTKRVAQAVDNWVEIVKRDSQERVPYRTGRTHDSWYKDLNIMKTTVRIDFGYDKNNEIEYLPIIWSKPDGFFRNGKEPFWLRRAVEANRDKLERELSNSKK